LEVIALKIRKLFTVVEESFSEAGLDIEPSLRKVAVVAVIKNPYAGKNFTQDLSAAIEESEEIGTKIATLGVIAMGQFNVESYGKAAVVGINGEQEHGVAMLTSVYGNAMRAAVGGGKAWVSSVTKRAMPGASIDIPLAHKDALYVRSHYDAMTVTLPDAPLPDEIAVICCLSNRGRPCPRVGGPTVDTMIGEDGLR
jgi:hypothetical protein